MTRLSFFEREKTTNQTWHLSKFTKNVGGMFLGPVREAKRYILSNSSPLEQGNSYLLLTQGVRTT